MGDEASVAVGGGGAREGGGVSPDHRSHVPVPVSAMRIKTET
jgi:hypothetical protein